MHRLLGHPIGSLKVLRENQVGVVQKNRSEKNNKLYPGQRHVYAKMTHTILKPRWYTFLVHLATKVSCPSSKAHRGVTGEDVYLRSISGKAHDGVDEVAGGARGYLLP